jgi:16S rRNA (adenine1518-N6/adenine1519-N6)-dimethyltransferase
MSAIRPRKRLGQNLLIHASVRDKIIAAASVTPSDIVIEIGPGKGALTFPLARMALFLVAVEIDPRFCAYLRQRLGDAPNVEIRNADFLRLSLHEEVSNLKKRFPRATAVKILSNLPFYITTPIVTRIIENRSSIDSCVVTVQKEVAERYTAGPGSRRYGAITLFLNYYARVSVLFPVSKEAFRPKPEVDGAVISLVPRVKPAVEVRDETLFFRVIRSAFGQRRKMLKTSLRSLGLPQQLVDSALDESGIDRQLRPERLAMEDFARLSDALSAAIENVADEPKGG